MLGIVIRLRPVVAVGLCVGLAVGAVVLGRAAGAVRVQASERKHPIYSVETDRKAVALGINCAWGNEDVPELIRVLAEAEVRASFFVVGDWCDKYPASVRQLYDAGHEIGTHSDTHADMTKLDRDGIIRELRDSAAKIERITGERPTLFRPPSGAYDSEVVQIAEEEGFYPIQWDCDSLDYRDPTAAEMEERIMKDLRNGSILLFHSGAKNTPAALPGILRAIRDAGYEFAAVSELIYPAPYVVDFEGRQRRAGGTASLQKTVNVP